jgi:predicted nucleic-acid-binding protein
MRAVDTNVLVRILARDDRRQAAAADAFVTSGAWVSVLALAEAVWVLASVYTRQPTEIAATVGQLLDHKELIIQDSDVVAAALTTFRARPVGGFTDCLLIEIARKAGHLPLGTFDRDLGKLDGAEQL